MHSDLELRTVFFSFFRHPSNGTISKSLVKNGEKGQRITRLIQRGLSHLIFHLANETLTIPTGRRLTESVAIYKA